MNANLKRILVVLSLLGLLLYAGKWAYWVWGTSLEDQLRERQQLFLMSVEERDWSALKAMLADDYLDDYGHDRESAISDAKQVLGSFFALTLKPQIIEFKVVPGLGMIKAVIRAEGRGAGFSDAVLSHINSLEGPWFFHWHKKGSWPWSWKVVQIHHENLHLPAL